MYKGILGWVLSPNYLKYVKIGGAEEHVFSSGKIAEIPPRKKQMQFLGIGHGRRAGTLLLLLLLMHFFFSLSHFKDYE